MFEVLGWLAYGTLVFTAFSLAIAGWHDILVASKQRTKLLEENRELKRKIAELQIRLERGDNRVESDSE